jgi:glucose/arabinose dehydrogenase
MGTLLRLTAAALVLLGLAATPAPAAITDGNFTVADFGSDVGERVTGMAWAPDGSNRLFITCQFGAVRIIQGGVLLPTPFVTFSPHTNSECGVIGLCFDPDFVNNHHVYFFVTVSASEQRIIRLNASGNTDTYQAASDDLVTGLPTAGNNHDGGGIGFGRDGKLYWAIGDLGNGTGVDGDLTSLAAKVGRANRDGTPCSDNPFYDGGGANNDYIWARGLRNPFTMAFQPATGRLWVNVVGDGWEQVFIVGAGDHVGYNDYEINQPAPTGGNQYIRSVLAYPTGGSGATTITDAVRSGNVVTCTTGANHNLRRGGRITISNFSGGDASLNGSAVVSEVVSGTQFRYAQTAGNLTAAGDGTVTPYDFGNAITGGTFWDSSAVPDAYRGDFFFTDYGSSQLGRADLDGAGNIVAVHAFGTGSGNATDMAVGPDGALYYASFGGVIHRVTYNNPPQGLVVTPLNLTLDEGGEAMFAVRLATAPAGAVTVAVARTSGDADVSVTGGATLTFTVANHATPQYVTLAAAEDADGSDDVATVRVSSTGLANVDVTVRVDDDSQDIVLSASSLTINEGANGTVTAALLSQPSSPVTVTVARTAGSGDITTAPGTLSFTSSTWNTPQTVTVSAANDGDAVNDTATISFSASGLTTRTVAVTAIDATASAPAITSTADTTAVAGALYRYDVEASGSPAPTFSLTTSPGGMGIDATTGVISWTPGATGTANVTVQAANGVTPNATQSFTITIAADQPPTATITQPTPGATVAGATAEFYGDGADDVGCVRAEFFVDGVLIYTDTNTANHYHVQGAHSLWDTTTLSNGPHTLRMRVYDTAGNSDDAEVTVTVDNRPGGGGGGGSGGSGDSRCGIGGLVASLSLMLVFLLGIRRLRP